MLQLSLFDCLSAEQRQWMIKAAECQLSDLKYRWQQTADQLHTENTVLMRDISLRYLDDLKQRMDEVQAVINALTQPQNQV